MRLDLKPLTSISKKKKKGYSLKGCKIKYQKQAILFYMGKSQSRMTDFLVRPQTKGSVQTGLAEGTYVFVLRYRQSPNLILI